MKILLRNGNQDTWKKVESFSYGDEIELQKLLSDSPDLIPAQDLREGSGQLEAVVREFGVDIGSIDILGFSAEGEIAVIECKLANNPEIKRKVIGQVLEYGAALWRMSYEEFDTKIQKKVGKPLADLVQDAVDNPEWDEELFRSNIEANLKEGNFILVIVVDEINDALTRIIRFLNACGSPNFSFAALEMRRFLSGDVEILLPKVDGDVRQASQRTSTSRRVWDKESLLQDAKEKLNPVAYDMLLELLAFSESHSDEVRYGSGIENGSFTFVCEKGDTKASIFSVFSNSVLQTNFHYMAKVLSDEMVAKFKTKLAEIDSFSDVLASDKRLYAKKLGEEIKIVEDIEAFKDWVLSVKANL